MDRMSVEAPTTRDELIGDLDDEQREAVLAARGPVCVLAGAGTGKTRTITRRIAHLVAAGHVAPHQVLAVTFTQRAAGEMRGRLRALDDGVGTGSVQAMTFHAAGCRTSGRASSATPDGSCSTRSSRSSRGPPTARVCRPAPTTSATSRAKSNGPRHL
jgi:hypothetical protein